MVPSATAIIPIQVKGQEKLGKLADRLRKEGSGGLRKRIDDGLKRNGDRALQALRRAWMGVDVKGSGSGSFDGPSGGSTGLRARIARATLLHDISGGLRYQTHSDMVDPKYGDILTHGVNGDPWYHPTFGGPPTTENEGEETFYSTLSKFYPVWEQGIVNGMENSARFIAGG